MAFDPIQEDCHRLVLEALRRDNIPLTDGPAVERLMEQFTRNPAPLIVHDRDRAGHLIAKVVEAVDYRIPFIPDDAQAEQEEAAAENMLREAAALDPTNWDAQRMLTALTADSNEEYVQYLVSKCDEVEHDLALKIAGHYLRILARSCPHAAEALYFQTEFPDGVYARVNVGTGSTDELVLALSEATPVLQEGLGAPDNASFAAWVATNDIVRSQIDERILRAAEQGLPFKGGDL